MYTYAQSVLDDLRWIARGCFGESSSVDLSLRKARSAAASSGNVPLFETARAVYSTYAFHPPLLLLFNEMQTLSFLQTYIFLFSIYFLVADFANLRAATSSLKRNRPHIDPGIEREDTLCTHIIYLLSRKNLHRFILSCPPPLPLILKPRENCKKVLESINKINRSLRATYISKQQLAYVSPPSLLSASR